MRILCFAFVSLLLSAQASADMQNARFVLHRKDAWRSGFPRICDNLGTPTVEPNYSPNYDGLPCSEYTTHAPLGPSTVYIVIGRAGSEGISAASFGIDYDGRSGQGIDPQYVSFIYCITGLHFPNSGEFGEFPAPKGGVRLTWLAPDQCPKEEIGSEGVHAVVGALYVYAYSPDVLRLTINDNLASGPELSIYDCSAQFNLTDLLNLDPPVPVTSLLGRIQFGEGSGGFNPCSQTPCSVPVAAIDVDPNTMNANSGGMYVNAFIELPTGYDPSEVNLDTVRLNGIVAAVPGSMHIGDWNGNLIPDFKVKFPRDEVEAVLDEGDQVVVQITGSIGTACDFTGTDLIRVIRPHVHHPNGGESLIVGAHTLIEWQNPQGWTVGQAQIYYSPDDGDTWQIVADQVIGETYAWRMPQAPTETGRLRVVLVDGEGVMGYDSSDGPFTIQAATGVEHGIPTANRLYANSPNPFRSATRTAFDLPEPGKVTLKVFDLAGREVRVLADGWYPAGAHEARWDATDAAGQAVAGGIYFLHMKVGSFTDSKRMYLQR